MDLEIHRSIPELVNATNKTFPQKNIVKPTMPYLWTATDTRNAALSTVAPVSVALVGASAIHGDKNLQGFFKSFRPPQWAIRDVRLYTALDVATIAPLGYASYLVYKNGGGFDYSDTTAALGIYGLNLVSGLALIPAFKNRNLKWIAINAGVVAATAIAASCAFGKIDKTAGYLLAPYAIWTTYYAVLSFALHNNSNKHLPESLQ